MSRKRKGGDPASAAHERKKRKKNSTISSLNSSWKESTVSSYYPRVLSLRAYVLSHLPVTSRRHRRSLENADKNLLGAELNYLLDSTLIGVLKEAAPAIDSIRTQELLAFSQQKRAAQTGTAGPPSTSTIREVRGLCLSRSA